MRRERLSAALRRGTYEDFLAVYRRRWVGYELSEGKTLLCEALTNSDLEHGRAPIAHHLLDDGVDVRRGSPLHVLIAQHHHDWEREPALLTRMLDLGADVNKSIRRDGTPLELLGSTFHVPEERLAGFYDVLLSRPDLDLARPGATGRRPVIDTLRLWREHRPELVRRAEERA